MPDLGVIQFSDLTLANKEYKEKKSLNLSLETWKICIHLKGTMGTDICFMSLNALACKGVITALNTANGSSPQSFTRRHLLSSSYAALHVPFHLTTFSSPPPPDITCEK